MPGWLILLILVAMLAGAVVVLAERRTDQKRRAERRRRFELRDTGERVPLAPPKEPTARRDLAEVTAFIASDPAALSRRSANGEAGVDPDPAVMPVVPRSTIVPRGRFVHTPDGEMLLTEPPFTLRETVFTKRNGRYAQALLRRLPPWLMICPKVRLDSMLTPT